MKRGGLEIQRLSCSRGFTQAKQNIDYDDFCSSYLHGNYSIDYCVNYIKKVFFGWMSGQYSWMASWRECIHRTTTVLYC